MENDIKPQSLLVGFQNARIDNVDVQDILKQIKAQKIGGVVLYKYNIENPNQLFALTSAIKSASENPNFIIAVDNEGGMVQRLTKEKGFESYPSAQEVVNKYSPEEAYNLYKEMANQLKKYNFNLNFGPVIDLHSDHKGGAIGIFKRSFSHDPQTVIKYAKAFIQAHRDCGIHTCLKHFPGHGYAPSDTHAGLVDVTTTYKKEEMLPFETLIKEGYADNIMTAHIIDNNVEENTPITLSKKYLDYLRQDLGFKGNIIADDINMGALVTYAKSNNMNLNDLWEKSILAGCDQVIKSNNKISDATGNL